MSTVEGMEAANVVDITLRKGFVQHSTPFREGDEVLGCKCETALFHVIHREGETWVQCANCFKAVKSLRVIQVEVADEEEEETPPEPEAA